MTEKEMLDHVVKHLLANVKYTLDRKEHNKNDKSIPDEARKSIDVFLDGDLAGLVTTLEPLFDYAETVFPVGTVGGDLLIQCRGFSREFAEYRRERAKEKADVQKVS